MAQKVALHILKSGVVLDRTQFIAQNADMMNDTITAITKEGKPLLVVESAETFFTVANLVQMVKDKDGRYNLIAEALDANGQMIGGAPPQIIIADVGEEQGKVVGKANVGNYPFAPVPANWSIGLNMSLGPTKIKRKIKSPNGDGTQFFMHPTEYERLWKSVSMFWAKKPGASQSLLISCNGGKSTAYFAADKITCNGYNIRRYEIEQVAKYRGWAFPNGVAIAA